MKKFITFIFLTFFFLLGNLNAQFCQETGTASGIDNTNPTITFNSFPCASTGTITAMTLDAAFTGTWCPSWYAYNIIVNGTTIATGQCNQTGFDLTPYLPVNTLQIQAYDTDAYGDNITINATVNITFTISTPYVLATPANVNLGYAASGTTSPEFTYSLVGDNLTGSPVTITAPVGFEVSLSSGTGFGPSVDVIFTPPTLGSTTVYVRFVPTGMPADYTGNITHIGGGANYNVSVSGTSLPQGDNCADAIDLSVMTSPLSATTTTANNDFIFCFMDASKDRIYYYDVEPGATIEIWQSFNNYDSRHTMRWGGVCPGDNEIACWDDPDYTPISWTNYNPTTERVWFIVAGFSVGEGDYTLEWIYTPAPDCIPPASLSTTNITSTSADLNWVGIESFFDIFIDVSGAPAPDNTTTPTIDNHNSTSYTWTGGAVNTAYAWYVRSDCDAGGGIGQSNWVGPMVFTTTVSCPAPSALTTVGTTTNSTTLQWTSIAGEFEIEYGVSPYTFTGTPNLTGILSNSTTISGLTSATTYQYQVKAICGPGDESLWSATGTFTTSCDVVIPAWMEDFSSATFPPICWSRAQGLLADPVVFTSTTYGSWFADDFANVGTSYTGSAKVNIYSTSYKDWLFTPIIDLGTGSTPYQLEFDLALTAYATTNPPQTNGIDDKFAVVISTDGGLTWSSANILRLWDNAGSAYVYNNISHTGEHIIIDLSSYTGQVIIGFYGESTVSNADNDLFIDNVKVVEIPDCPPPTALSVSNITTTTANLSWTSAVGLYDVEAGLPGFTPGTNNAVSWNYGNIGEMYQAWALTPATNYEFYVRADCGSGLYSDWAGPYSFTTAQPSLYVNPGALAFGYTASGTYSASQSYILTGEFLSGYPDDIAVTAPAGFEVSLDNSTWFATVNVPYTSETLAATTIYARFAPTGAPAPFSGDITNVGGSASANVAVTGSSILTYCNSNFSNVTYEHITNVTFAGINNSSGGNTGGPVNYTNLVAYLIEGNTYPISVTILPDAAEYIYVFIDWNKNGILNDAGEVYTVASSVSTSGPHTMNITVPVGATFGNTRMRVMVDYNNAVPDPCRNATYGEAEDYTVNISSASAPNLIVNTSSLNFGYVVSGNTAELNYDLSGTNLTGAPGDIVVTAPSGFEVSLTSGAGFASSINVPYTTSTLASTTIYVKFSPTGAPASYSGDISNVGGGATTDIAVSGSSVLTYCIDPVYSLGYLTCDNNFGITNVTFADLNNTSACNTVAPYFTLYNTPQATVLQGETYPLSVSLQGTTSYITYIKVYIDFNENGSFDDPGEMIYNTGNVGGVAGPFVSTYTIPISTPVGQYRMRVRCADDDVNSCSGDGIVGEVEDYIVNVMPAPSCPAPSALSATNITESSAELLWTENGTATAWEVEWGLNGFTPGTGTTVSVSTNPTTVLSNLSSGNVYQFYVKSVCGVGDESSLVGPYAFTTLCDVIVAPFIEDFEFIPPTCWGVSSTTSNNWAISTSASGYGTGNNSAVAQFYSYSDTTPFYLISPDFDASGLATPTLRFDYAYATYVSEVDQLNVLYSTDGGATLNTLLAMPGGVSGLLNTAGATTSSFVPLSGDWSTIELALPAGTNLIVLEAISAYGNNLFVDNFEIFDDIPPTKELNLNAYLEGLYLGSGMMREAQGLTGPEYGAGIADQITVELIDINDLTTVYYQNTGVILNTDGTASVTDVPGTLGDEYYIVIKHRNSIETWSAAPVSFAGVGPISYNFTMAASQAYGSNQLSVSGGFYAIFSGDANQDAIVDGSDMLEIENASNVFLQGYNAQDLNGDGIVDGSDMLLIENNANNFVQTQKP